MSLSIVTPVVFLTASADMETQQPVVSPNEEDSIQSFSESCPPTILEIPEASMAESDVLEKQMDCLCGVQVCNRSATD